MKEIIKGVINHHLKDATPEANRRYQICLDCDSSYNDLVLGKRCKECGCILKYKVKSDSNCPLGKW